MRKKEHTQGFSDTVRSRRIHWGRVQRYGAQQLAARTWMLCSTAMSESHAHVTVRDWFEKLPRRHPQPTHHQKLVMMAFGSRALSVGYKS